MLKAFKKAEQNRGPFRRLSDSEILLFVSRTLQGSEPDVPDVHSKLQCLKDILDQQEIDLLDWPESPSKHRFYGSLLKAKGLAVQISEYLTAVKNDSAASDEKNA